MKTILMTIIVFVSAFTFAAEPELPLKSDPNGKLSFGMQYAYDMDMFWGLTYTTTISNQTLETLPDSIFWNMLDVSTQAPFASWTEINKADLMVGTLGLKNKSVVAKLLPQLRSAKVAFGVKNSEGKIDLLYSIPLQPLCENHSKQIVDLTDFSKGACTVSARDIP